MCVTTFTWVETIRLNAALFTLKWLSSRSFEASFCDVWQVLSGLFLWCCRSFFKLSQLCSPISFQVSPHCAPRSSRHTSNQRLLFVFGLIFLTAVAEIFVYLIAPGINRTSNSPLLLQSLDTIEWPFQINGHFYRNSLTLTFLTAPLTVFPLSVYLGIQHR